MRFLFLLLLSPVPAFSWEFSRDPVCRLHHQSPSAQIDISFNSEPTRYQLSITLSGLDWNAAPSFGIFFDGGKSLTIGTDRHIINGDTLSVVDSGFGNVLNGLEFNQVATAFTSSHVVTFNLEGAADAVRQFRDCTKPLPALS